MEIIYARNYPQADNANGDVAKNICRFVFCLHNPKGADIVFETAGSAVTVKQAPYLVMRGGKIMIVGTVPGDSAINFLKINREVTIQTVFRYANRYPVTIEAISSGRFDVKSMVTHIYDYRDVQQAFEESVNNKRDIIKGVIKISD